MSGDCDRAELLALLEDEYARAILTATSDEPMSATTLSEYCDASRSTVYRRLERLQECGLIEERMRFDADGHHHNVYVSRLEGVEIEFVDGEMSMTVSERELPEEDYADRLAHMWEEL